MSLFPYNSCAMSIREASGREEAYGMSSRALRCKVGKNLSHYGRKLESVAGESASDAYGRSLWMRPDDEVLVRSHGVKAGLSLDHLTGKSRKAWRELFHHLCAVSLMDRAIDGLRRALAIAPMNRRFYAAGRAIHSRKSVGRPAILGFRKEYRKVFGEKWGNAIQRLDPKYNLACDSQWQNTSQCFRRPRSGCNHEMSCFVHCAVGRYFNAIGMGLPAKHSFLDMQDCAAPLRETQLGAYALLRQKVTSKFLVHRNIARKRCDRRKPGSNLGWAENRMPDRVLRDRGNAPGDELPRFRAQDQAARDVQQSCSTISFQLAPQFIRVQHQRNVERALAVGLANHARSAVRRSLVVRRGELIDAKNSFAALSQLLRCGAAHGAESENDHIVAHYEGMQIGSAA